MIGRRVVSSDLREALRQFRALQNEMDRLLQSFGGALGIDDNIMLDEPAQRKELAGERKEKKGAEEKEKQMVSGEEEGVIQPWLAGPLDAQWYPALDVKQTEDALIASAELPGLSKDDVTIEVHDNILRFGGERKFSTEREEGGWRRTERSYGRFERAVQLPPGAKEGDIKAQMRNGLLTITVPLDANVHLRAQPHRIAIEDAPIPAEAASAETAMQDEESAYAGEKETEAKEEQAEMGGKKTEAAEKDKTVREP